MSGLMDIRTAWRSAIVQAARVASIRFGVGTPLLSLQATVNVLDEAAADNITGGIGSDWYFRTLDDVISDVLTAEFYDILQ